MRTKKLPKPIETKLKVLIPFILKPSIGAVKAQQSSNVPESTFYRVLKKLEREGMLKKDDYTYVADENKIRNFANEIIRYLRRKPRKTRLQRHIDKHSLSFPKDAEELFKQAGFQKIEDFMDFLGAIKISSTRKIMRRIPRRYFWHTEWGRYRRLKWGLSLSPKLKRILPIKSSKLNKLIRIKEKRWKKRGYFEEVYYPTGGTIGRYYIENVDDWIKLGTRMSDMLYWTRTPKGPRIKAALVLEKRLKKEENVINECDAL